MTFSLTLYNLIGILVGSILLIVGLITYFRVVKIKPNTYLGFRVPVAFLSNNVWKEINKLAGIIDSVIGLALISLGLLTRGITILITTFIAISLGISLPIIFTKYRMELLTGLEPGASEPIKILELIKVNKVIYILSMLSFVMIFVFTFMYFDKLPEKLAVHFDITGKPDLYMNKNDFIATFLTFTASFLIISQSLLYAIDGVPNVPEFEEYNNKLKIIFMVFPFLIAIFLLGVVWFIFSYNL